MWKEENINTQINESLNSSQINDSEDHSLSLETDLTDSIFTIDDLNSDNYLISEEDNDNNQTELQKLTTEESSRYSVISLNEDEEEKKKKKQFKFPSSMLIVFTLLFTFIILTWIVPHQPLTQQSSAYPVHYDVPWNDPYFNFLDVDGNHEISSFGILDSGFAIVLGFYQALGIILYLFALGAILEILIRTETFERSIGSSMNGLKNNKIIIVPILFAMFSLFGSIWGMQEESLPYYAIMIPFLVLSGFPPVTAIMIMMLGNTTGMMASITNPFSIGVAISSSEIPNNINVSIGDGIVIRSLIWVIVTTVGAIFVTHFALKHSKDNDEKFEEELKKYEEKVEQEINLDDFEIKTLQRKHTLSLIAFTITFLLLVVGLIPWNTDPNGYGFGGQYISTIWAPIGHWGFAEMSVLIFFGILAQILIHGPKKYNWVEILMSGAKGMVTVAVVIAIARGASIVLFYSGLSNALVLGLTNNIIGEDVSPYVFLIIIFLISLLIGLLIPSTSGSATLLFPILSGVIFKNFADNSDGGAQMLVLSIIAYAMALGMANMITPAQPVVLASVDYTGLQFNEYFKIVWKYFAIQFVVVIAIILPLTLITL